MKLHLDLAGSLKYGGLVLASIGILSAVHLVAFGDTPISRQWARYQNHLDRQLRLLFMSGSGKAILTGQVTALALLCAVEVAVFDVPYWYVIAVLIVIGPVAYLARERQLRIEKLEMQVDGFILALANSLKTVPSPGAALQSVLPLLQNPTAQEIEVVIKEMRVGNTLEQSLVNMSSRIGSRTVDSALSAVLIGLQVGGNLPQVLETTASTIREMNRLEGVVRTKTSEGRAQLWVLALFPFCICYAFNAVQEGYFLPLQTTFVGYIIVAIAVTFWVASIAVAIRVLRVDI
ncbi:MAG: type II secretion system F family protein [Polyangiaceae bacterium]|nr:type II secretion system F family protein [Polyangiaceae bacterium]